MLSLTPHKSRPFETLVGEVSSRLIEASVERIGDVILTVLPHIVDTLGVERCTLSMVDSLTGQFRPAYSWAIPGVASIPTTVSSRTYPWATQRFCAGLPVVFSRLADLPPEAAGDAVAYAGIGLRSHVAVPVLVAGDFTAVLGVGMLRSERTWTSELVDRVFILARLFGSALARKRSHERIDELLGFEQLLVELSTSLVGTFGAMLDSKLDVALEALGTRLGANRIRLWSFVHGATRLAVVHKWTSESTPGVPEQVGAAELPWLVNEMVAGRVINFPTLAAMPPGAEKDVAVLSAAGVKSVLAIPLHGDASGAGAISLVSVHEERVWRDEIVPQLALFGRMLLGALIHRRDEQTARVATAEVAEVRERLAHLARVEAVSAMSAAIAHEINQPLTAIENYAMAGRRRLANANSCDRVKLDELMQKIGKQATHASEVLDRLGAMVKRRETQEVRIDLSRLVRDVVQIIEIEGQLKGVRIETELAQDIPFALGDDIQIQQVVINLARNAMEAMGAVPPPTRVLRLAVAGTDSDTLMVCVSDRGPGIADADAEKVFEPFHTTKETGLGIGLSISRTIIEAHGGKLWHVANPGGGTVFQFTLPNASEGA